MTSCPRLTDSLVLHSVRSMWFQHLSPDENLNRGLQFEFKYQCGCGQFFFCYTEEVGEKDASAGNLMGNFSLLTRYSHAC